MFNSMGFSMFIMLKFLHTADTPRKSALEKFLRKAEVKLRFNSMGFSGAIILAGFLSTLRAFILGAFGAVFTRFQMFDDHTKRQISRILYYFLTPLLLFISLASLSSIKSLLAESFILFIVPWLYTLFGILLGYAFVIIFRQEDFRFSIIAATSMQNSFALPVVMTISICDVTGNTVSGQFSSSLDCSKTGLGLVGLYSICSNFSLFVIGKQLMSYDLILDKKRSLERELINVEASKKDDSVSAEVIQVEEKLHQVHDEKQIVEEKDKEERDNFASSTTENTSLDGRLSFCYKGVFKFLQKLYKYSSVLFPPPFIGTLFGLVVALIPAIQNWLFNSDASSWAKTFVSIIRSVGDCTIPFSLFVLGSDLAQGPQPGKLKRKSIFAVLIARLIAMPLVGWGMVWVFLRIGILNSNNPMLSFIVLIQGAVPSAISLNMFTQLNNYGQQEVSTILFWQYMASILTVAMWVSVFLIWL